jgi:hypothetical protein
VLGFTVSGVSMPIRRIVSLRPSMRAWIVSPSTTRITVAFAGTTVDAVDVTAVDPHADASATPIRLIQRALLDDIGRSGSAVVVGGDSPRAAQGGRCLIG